MAKKTTTIALSQEMMEQAQREASRLGLSFSDFVNLLLNQYFDDIHFGRKRNWAETEVSQSPEQRVGDEGDKRNEFLRTP